MHRIYKLQSEQSTVGRGTMKIFQTATIVSSVSCLVLLTTVSFQPAQPRTITFEMGEGGHSVTFPMTEKEIVEYEKHQKTIKAIIANKKRIKPQVVSFELQESGITIDFPMSAKEMLRQQLDKQFSDIDKRNKRNADALERKETIEMADGLLITF